MDQGHVSHKLTLPEKLRARQLPLFHGEGFA